MASISFTATRELANGAINGDTVVVDFGLSKFDDQPKDIKHKSTPIDGDPIFFAERIELRRKITTVVVDGADYLALRMFSYSVMGGVQFLADWDAENQAAASYTTWVIEDTPKFKRVETLDQFQISFTALEL